MNLPWDVNRVYLIRTSYAKSGKMKCFIRECQAGKKDTMTEMRSLKIIVGMSKL